MTAVKNYPYMVIKTVIPERALEWLDGWSVEVEMVDGAKVMGTFRDLSHDNSELGAQLFGIEETMKPGEIFFRSFIGNVVEVVVM